MNFSEQRPLHWNMYIIQICICILFPICTGSGSCTLKGRCLHIVTKWQFPFCYFISTSGMYVLHVYLWVYLYSPSIKVHCRATPATLLANQPPASSWYNLSVWTPLFKPLYIARNIFITTINITITMGKSSMNMYIFENLSIFVCVYHSVLLWD